MHAGTRNKAQVPGLCALLCGFTKSLRTSEGIVLIGLSVLLCGFTKYLYASEGIVLISSVLYCISGNHDSPNINLSLNFVIYCAYENPVIILFVSFWLLPCIDFANLE